MDFSKTPGSRRNAVRQIKGPGMNKGLPKRHKMAKPKALTGKDGKPRKRPFGAVGGKGRSGVRTDNTTSNPLNPSVEIVQGRDPSGLRRKTWSGGRDYGKKSSKKVF
jgi:hypothetical protein